VAQFGQWIKGSGDWRSRAQISDRAVNRKWARISSLLRSSAQRWSRLHPIFHAKYKTTIRRELQRLELLLNRAPIPPTPLLDSDWEGSRDSASALLQLARDLHLPKSCETEVEFVCRTSLT
jgi:hypothetical protein